MKRSERKKRTFRQGGGIAVIGEGPTEQYYLLSIQGLMAANVYPKIVKDGIEYLAAKVEECIAEGYDKVYCLIDLDNKSDGKEKKRVSDLPEKVFRENLQKQTDRYEY